MMGVGVPGRLLQAGRMQGGERGIERKKQETKGQHDRTCGEEGEKKKNSQLTLEESD